MVTDQQVRRLRRLDLCGLSQERVADKAGMDAKTARKYRRLGKLPSEVRRMERDYRTRNDPFAEVWPQLETQLQRHPGLEAKTLFADLQRRFPGRFADGQLRTLQRRIKQWRALCGPAKEVFFAQVHQPGRLCASDFTHCSELRVTIAGTPFDYRIYHFVLTYSNGETGTICFAESYESLSEGLQNALWEKATSVGDSVWPKSCRCCIRCHRVVWSRVSVCGCVWTGAARSTFAATPIRCAAV